MNEVELPSDKQIRRSQNRLRATIASEKYTGGKSKTEAMTHPVLTPFTMAMESLGYPVASQRKSLLLLEHCEGCSKEGVLTFKGKSRDFKVCGFCKK